MNDAKSSAISVAERIAGSGATTDQAVAAFDIADFDVADDALERAASATEGQAVTFIYCTHWYHCGWPL
jgi:hypothetical protein